MGFLQNKKALIVGLLSDRSIAYGIAEAMHREGAELAFTYQNEKFQERVSKLASNWNANLITKCDVSEDSEIQSLCEFVKEHWGKVDIVVHSVAFAPSDQLNGSYVENTTREGFRIAHDVSSYSFVALAKSLAPLMSSGGSLLTLTYIGAERVIPNYNVMGVAKASLEANVRYMAGALGPQGIRVNAVSAGPIRTLAASGIHDFKRMLEYNETITPLRQNVSQEQVGNVAAFLCSDLASAITGEIVHADAGYHIL